MLKYCYSMRMFLFFALICHWIIIIYIFCLTLFTCQALVRASLVILYLTIIIDRKYYSRYLLKYRLHSNTKISRPMIQKMQLIISLALRIKCRTSMAKNAKADRWHRCFFPVVFARSKIGKSEKMYHLLS